MDAFKEQAAQMSNLVLSSPLHTIGFVTGVFTLYIAILAIYRTWFHPLSHIPGPWLGKVSFWLEFYYDCLQEGYVKVYPELHAKYGKSRRKNYDCRYESDL